MTARLRVACVAVAAVAALAACSGERAATPAAPDRPPPLVSSAAPIEPSDEGLTVATPTGCSADCEGEPTPALVEAVRVRALDARRCYDAALRRDRALTGRIVVGLQITADGAVCATRQIAGKLDDAELLECVRDLFVGLRLPPPEGGCVDLALPLNLVPASADAGAAEPDAAAPAR